MRNGEAEFVEKFDADGSTRIVRRDRLISPDAKLPEVHAALVGDKLLDYCLDTYTASGIVPRSTLLPIILL